MKKLLIFSLVFSLLLGVLGAYTVPTSRGDIELTVPDGLTLEEAYIEIARLYLEERWDHEKLLEESALLTKELDIYIEENRQLRAQYNKLLMSYTKIDELYVEITKVDPVSNIIMSNISYDMLNKGINLSITGGWCFYEVLDISAGLSAVFGPNRQYNSTAVNLNLRYIFE